MSFEPVAYEDVRSACCALLAKGEGPSRPKVQEEMASRIGRKGSNSVVSGYINQFWAEAADRMNRSLRVVEEVPEEYVPILDRALLEMVSVSRKIADELMTARELSLQEEIKGWKASIQRANESAEIAEQLRIRTEGELNGLNSALLDLRATLRTADERIAEESRKRDELMQKIEQKDAELQRQHGINNGLMSRIEKINEAHKEETHRLMLEIDSERVSAKRAAASSAGALEKARSDIDTLREQNVHLREINARQDQEIKSNSQSLVTLNETIADQKRKIEDGLEKIRAHSERIAVFEFRAQAAEIECATAKSTVSAQAEEIGRLKGSAELYFSAVQASDAGKAS